MNAYCCHYYGSQAWSDKHVESITIACNRAVSKIWNLPNNRSILSGLDNGANAWDYIFDNDEIKAILDHISTV